MEISISGRIWSLEFFDDFGFAYLDVGLVAGLCGIDIGQDCAAASAATATE